MITLTLIFKTQHFCHRNAAIESKKTQKYVLSELLHTLKVQTRPTRCTLEIKLKVLNIHIFGFKMPHVLK